MKNPQKELSHRCECQWWNNTGSRLVAMAWEYCIRYVWGHFFVFTSNTVVLCQFPPQWTSGANSLQKHLSGRRNGTGYCRQKVSLPHRTFNKNAFWKTGGKYLLWVVNKVQTSEWKCAPTFSETCTNRLFPSNHVVNETVYRAHEH